mgnify:CR=1 FL=1
MEEKEAADVVAPAFEVFLVGVLFGEPLVMVREDVLDFEGVLGVGVHVVHVTRGDADAFLNMARYAGQHVLDVCFSEGVETEAANCIFHLVFQFVVVGQQLYLEFVY